MTRDVAAEPAVLSARGIRVVVEGERSGALRRRRPARGIEGLDLDVLPGQVVTLVGGPGSGVAEAIEVLSGARAPEAGRLRIDATDVTVPDRRARGFWRERVAVLGTAPGSSRRTVLEVVADDIRGSQEAPPRSVQEEHRERADQVLDRVGLPPDLRARKLRDLPAEHVGRVGLARLLARPPGVVVVPPDCVVPGVEEELVDALLTSLRQEPGVAVVRATDRLPATLGADERALVLCGGRVVESLGAPDLAHPLHPWTRALQAGAEPVTSRSDLADPGCPFRARCDRAQARCTERMPELTRPLGASHPVACWFPEDPRPGRRAAGAQPGTAGAAAPPPALGDEPTAHEFVEG